MRFPKSEYEYQHLRDGWNILQKEQKDRRKMEEYDVIIEHHQSIGVISGVKSDRHVCTPVFISALFIIARTWKQPRCPSADKWIRKLWYIYTMEYIQTLNQYGP